MLPHPNPHSMEANRRTKACFLQTTRRRSRSHSNRFGSTRKHWHSWGQLKQPYTVSLRTGVPERPPGLLVKFFSGLQTGHSFLLQFFQWVMICREEAQCAKPH